MIIDILDQYPPEEREHLNDIAIRWHVRGFHDHPSSDINLHYAFPDAPYWGDGVCEHDAKCKVGDCSCKPKEDSDYGVVDSDYEDKEYNEWFDNLIHGGEADIARELEDLYKRQSDLFNLDEGWEQRYIKVTIQLLEWLNKKNITYCIIKQPHGYEDDIYFKNFLVPGREYRILFGAPDKYDFDYAVDKMGWIRYYLKHLGSSESNFDIKEWIDENHNGIVYDCGLDVFVFEEETDVMGLEMRWKEYGL